MSTPDVSTLQHDIDAARNKYQALRTTLTGILAPLKPPAEMPDHLISYAEEFGPAHAAKTLADNPQHFGVKFPPALRQQVAPLVLQLVDSSHALDGLIAKREDILCKADPTRRRVYMHYGREFVMDVRKGTMTFLDDPAHPQPLNLQQVPTRDQPEQGRQLPPGSAVKDEPTR